MRDDTTPLMYSSFYDDENTMKELINLGANLRAKDKYGLNPLAYAIENNSTKTAKLLLDNGVKFDEVEFIQFYLSTPQYQDFIDKIIIDGDNIKIIYKFDYGDKSPYSKNKANPFRYIISHNLIEILEMIFNTGYKKDNETFLNFKDGYYSALPEIPNYEQMLDLLLEHNISGQPSKEFLMSEYEECYEEYEIFLDTQSNYNKGELQLKDYEISDLKRTLAYYSKNCNVENSTFTTKSYIIWKNTSNKNWAIDVFLKNYRDDSTKVIYIDKNSSNNK